MIKLAHFKPGEFNHPDKMVNEFLLVLDWIRSRCGIPFYLTSDFRPGDKGLHGQGQAVDFGIPYKMPRPWEQYWIVAKAVIAAEVHFNVPLQFEIVHNTADDVIPGKDMHLHIGLLAPGRKSQLIILPN